jgi:outer membrane lipoprotein-sorting protein
MLRTSTLFLAGLALALSSPFAPAQDDENRALVQKAMKAHGGKELIKKYRSAEIKMTGSIKIMGVEAKFKGDVAFQFPDKMRNSIAVEINNMNIDVVQVFDGKTFYVNAAGKTIELKEEKFIDEMKESIYVEKVSSLVDLDDKEYKLSALGEAKVSGKDAVGIRVSREGKRDVNLYFDKNTSLLVKYEFRGRDPIGMMEVTQEKILSEYKEVMGIQSAMKLAVHFDGNPAMELEVTSIRYAESLDESLFAKP